MTIIAAADGSALGNPGPAGWAWYIDDTSWHAGGWKNATNNRGELMAVLDLLWSTADSDEGLKIYCDSQYVINALTKWMPGWKRKGWKKADGKEVLNKDLLASLDEALSGRTVEFEWVKGHNNHELNEAADDRARAAATAFQKGTAVPEGPGFVPAGTSAAPAEDEPAEEPTEPSLHEDVLTEPSTAAAGSATTVVSCRVPSTVADELVARAQSRGIHPQEFLAELIGRSLETE
ncbi:MULTISPECIES: ribonuclease H family protein [Brevibacterium]|uniref:Ribonuclease H n=2 Tax=Brevibacterium TaxID=1696 RepID=A0A0B9A424_BRELN|nr:ribonuclease H [Brevibacterium linens]AMT93994.1 ribonuclease H [Brevibacterium linens]KHS53463.1 Ribonuclease H [Brevibacterium linens]